uniref:RRM domain-containing protein n=1 Tax=Timema monikensis TaxID=170555 RepID=A0A7R9HKP8_9NEOP|nr:unnamed protein product [Timema monikensis]
MDKEQTGENVLESKTKNKKRQIQDDNAMEVDRGIEGKKRPEATVPKRGKQSLDKIEIRKVPVPSHRYTPLKENWMKIFSPVVEHLHLQIRFNLKTRNVEIRSCSETQDISNLQKAADFVKAFIYGFDVEDALALLRLDDLFVETFEVKDVKQLKGKCWVSNNLGKRPVRFKLNHASTTGRSPIDREFSLWVGDLTPEVDDYTLYRTFASRYPSVRTAKVILDSAGYSKGYGFIRFANEEEQKTCLKQMNSFTGLGGKPLKISNAVPKAHRMSGGRPELLPLYSSSSSFVLTTLNLTSIQTICFTEQF